MMQQSERPWTLERGGMATSIVLIVMLPVVAWPLAYVGFRRARAGGSRTAVDGRSPV